MRNLEFRAWDEKTKKMYPVDSIYWDEDGIEMVGLRYKKNSGVLRAKEDGEFFLMQFTGLLDKNGKKIFEGDILQHENPFDVPLVVEFSGGAFHFNNEHWQITDKSFHVIGNIHSNPELLKDKQ